MTDWLRRNPELVIDAEDLRSVLSAVRERFSADIGEFVSESTFAQLLEDLKQWPRPRSEGEILRWRPRLQMLANQLRVLEAMRWLEKTRSGAIETETYDEALQQVLAASRLDVNRSQMIAALRARGLDPERRHRENGDSYWVVNIPDRS